MLWSMKSRFLICNGIFNKVSFNQVTPYRCNYQFSEVSKITWSLQIHKTMIKFCSNKNCFHFQLILASVVCSNYLILQFFFQFTRKNWSIRNIKFKKSRKQNPSFFKKLRLRRRGDKKSLKKDNFV